MVDFDPADPPENVGVGHQSTAVEMYEKLIERGDTETAEELRSKDSPSRMVRFAKNYVVEFDPKHEDDTPNTDRVTVKNTYDALVELGYDERAEKLREFTTVQAAAKHVRYELLPELEAEEGVTIDDVTGEYEAPPERDQSH